MLKDYLAISSLPFVEKSLDEFLKFVNRINISNVEIVIDMYDEEELNKIKEYDFKVISHAPWYDVNIGHPNERIRKCSIETIKDSIRLCYNIGCELLTVHSGRVSSITYGKRFKVVQRTIESLREIVRYAKNYNVDICLENATKSLEATCDKFDEFMYVLDNVEDLYITLDVGHALTCNEIEKYLNVLNDNRLKNIHIHDNNGSYDEHLAIGDGILKDNIKKILEAYKDRKFFLTIEVSDIKYVEKSLNFLMHAFNHL